MQTASFPVNGVVGAALVSTAFEAALVVDDASWRVVAATPSSESLYGASLIGVALETLFALDQEKAVGDVVHAAESGPIELSLERVDGELRAVVVRAARLELDGCTACVVALRDVTRERELESELSRVRSFHRTLLDALGIGVLTLDSSGRILDHNHFEPLTRLFGEDLRSRNFFLEIVTTDEARAVFERLQASGAKVDDAPFVEVIEFDAGGRIFEVEVHAGAHAGDADVLVRVSDSTDRLGAERELRHQRFQAEEAARRSRLVYQTASLIHRSLGVDEVFETAVAETGRLLSASRCQIVLLDPDGEIRVAHEYRRPNLLAVEPFAADLDASPLVASAVRGLTPLVVENAEIHPQADLRGLLAASGARATLVAPIAVGREARGVLAIHDCEHLRHWSDADVELAASIGSQVGLAIAHTESLDRVRRQAEREAVVGRLAAEIHAAGSLEGAFEIASSTLGSVLDAEAVEISIGSAGSHDARAWSWRARRARRVPSATDEDDDATSVTRAVTAPFAIRDGGHGVLRVERTLPTDKDAEALVEAVAVHLGVAISASGLLEAVTAAKAVWEGTFDAMADGIVVHDDTARVVRANTAFIRLMKLDFTSILDKDFFELFSPENREILAAARDRVAATRRHADIELFEPATGRHLSISVSRLTGESRLTFIYTVRDVTEGRMISERLTQSAKMASIGNLAAGVAHEINTPLATIAGSAQSLSRQLAGIPELVEGQRWSAISERLEAIVAQSFRCKRITHDLLNFAAPTRPTLAPTDIVRVAREAIEMLERERGESHVRIVEAGSAPGVVTDAELLRQVLINLVANALDAVDERGAGDVTVTIRGLRRSARIEVRDTGAGIAETDLDRIFDPFFTTKPPGRGTGLGLSISHNIVSSLGGQLEAKSKVGRGSTFVVRLPVGKVKA